jgi:uncharacterized membrane protein (UPF0127 family)
MQILNKRTGRVVASAVEIATTRKARRRGLLGRQALDPAAAMVLSPCCAIHTAFMRFPIDAAFVDREGRVTRMVCGMTPWRLAIAPRAHAVVEFAGGCLSGRDVAIGDRLYLAPAAGDDPGAGEAVLSWSDLSSSFRMTASKPATSGS